MLRNIFGNLPKIIFYAPECIQEILGVLGGVPKHYVQIVIFKKISFVI